MPPWLGGREIGAALGHSATKPALATALDPAPAVDVSEHIQVAPPSEPSRPCPPTPSPTPSVP